MLEYIKYLPSQENIDCCASSATLLAAEILMSMNGVHLHLSRLFPYYMARRLQGRIGQRGTELKAVLESLVIHGVCLDQQWPLRHSLINREPSVQAQEQAKLYRVNSFQHVPVQDISDKISQNIPVVVGLRTGRQFWKMSGNFDQQIYSPVNDTDNRYSHSHAVTIVRDLVDRDSWIVANSRGLRWGNRGLGILPYSCSVDIGESYSITEFAGFQTGKKFSTIDK